MLSSASLPKLSSSLMMSPRLRVASNPSAASALAPVITCADALATLSTLASCQSSSLGDVLQAILPHAVSPQSKLHTPRNCHTASLHPTNDACIAYTPFGSSSTLRLSGTISSRSTVGSLSPKVSSDFNTSVNFTQMFLHNECIDDKPLPPVKSERERVMDSLRAPLPSLQLLFPVAPNTVRCHDETTAEGDLASDVHSSASIITDEPIEASVQYSDDIDSPSYDARFLSPNARLRAQRRSDDLRMAAKARSAELSHWRIKCDDFAPQSPIRPSILHGMGKPSPLRAVWTAEDMVVDSGDESFHGHDSQNTEDATENYREAYHPRRIWE